jgi:hypothetical protein
MNRGEQAGAVNAVVAQHRGLAPADPVQGLHRQRSQPCLDLIGLDGQDAAEAQGFGRRRSRRR